MKIFPAIDIKDGKVVRLKYGDYGQMCTYSQTPFEALASFAADGADHVHIVDLDGAKDGYPVNFALISRLTAAPGFFSEVGGGIRTLESIQSYLTYGAGRVILGTAALQNRELLQQAVELYGSRLAVGVDARDGKVAVDGCIPAVRIVTACAGNCRSWAWKP